MSSSTEHHSRLGFWWLLVSLLTVLHSPLKAQLLQLSVQAGLPVSFSQMDGDRDGWFFNPSVDITAGIELTAYPKARNTGLAIGVMLTRYTNYHIPKNSPSFFPDSRFAMVKQSYHAVVIPLSVVSRLTQQDLSTVWELFLGGALQVNISASPDQLDQKRDVLGPNAFNSIIEYDVSLNYMTVLNILLRGGFRVHSYLTDRLALGLSLFYQMGLIPSLRSDFHFDIFSEQGNLLDSGDGFSVSKSDAVGVQVSIRLDAIR